ncbi:MAG: serine acetyltransferase [Clostridia bacterium]|nr:serine acetyltransferase [Clostridia bacterium]MBR6619631.1 serine acetyltransferase [Clostridia bacterium]
MIKTKADLQEYLLADAKANGRSTIKAARFGDDIWKFILSLRKMEFYINKESGNSLLNRALRIFHIYMYHHYCVKYCFTIPANVFDKGLSIAHIGTIAVSMNAHVGKNCRIHEGVTIGTTNGQSEGATIGNNVFIGTGAKIIGDIYIADDVAIGANAVVTKSIDEPGTTWAGVPAKKISNNNSHSNLNPKIFE